MRQFIQATTTCCFSMVPQIHFSARKKMRKPFFPHTAKDQFVHKAIPKKERCSEYVVRRKIVLQ